MPADREGKSTARITVESGAFRPGDTIPREFSCDGEDCSPPISWSDVPVETKSFALLVEDPDAPRGTFVHWVLYNLPADTVELAAGVPRQAELPSGARQGINTGGRVGYTGPCPPPGSPHHYHFRVFALDTALQFDAPPDGARLRQAMSGHVLAQGDLIGIFGR